MSNDNPIIPRMCERRQAPQKRNNWKCTETIRNYRLYYNSKNKKMFVATHISVFVVGR